MLNLIFRHKKIYYLDWSVTDHLPVINDFGIKKFKQNILNNIDQLTDFLNFYLDESNNKQVSIILDESDILISLHKNTINVDLEFLKYNINQINFGEYKDSFSSNYYNFGITEQHMIGLHLQTTVKNKIIN